MKRRHFKQTETKSSTARIWNVKTKGNECISKWYQEGSDKIQKTKQVFKPLNVGRRNEKSAEDVAVDYAERQILLKRRQGFREYDKATGKFLESEDDILRDNSVDFSKKLPQNFRAYKPQNTLSKYLLNLIEKQEARFLVKRNGNMATFVIDSSGRVEMYSSSSTYLAKKEDRRWIERFPAFEKILKEKPRESILFCEIVNSQGKDNLDYVGKVMRTKTDKALETQAKDHPLNLMIWDVAWYEGRKLIGVETIEERLNRIVEFTGGVVFGPTTRMFKTLEDAYDEAKDLGYEGFVVVDPKDTYGDVVSFNGKPQRPKTCGKAKPSYEADFILRWDPDNGEGTWGKGRNTGGIGALFAYLINDGKEQFISKIPSLSQEQIHGWADPSIWPQVGEVKFTSVTKDTSLEFPSFVRLRPDKSMSECTIDQLPYSARR